MRKLTTPEAAKRLGVTVRTIFRYRDAGKLHEVERIGTAAFWDEREVNDLAGIETPDMLTLEDVADRLKACETWDDVSALAADIDATITATI